MREEVFRAFLDLRREECIAVEPLVLLFYMLLPEGVTLEQIASSPAGALMNEDYESRYKRRDGAAAREAEQTRLAAIRREEHRRHVIAHKERKRLNDRRVRELIAQLRNLDGIARLKYLVSERLDVSICSIPDELIPLDLAPSALADAERKQLIEMIDERPGAWAALRLRLESGVDSAPA